MAAPNLFVQVRKRAIYSPHNRPEIGLRRTRERGDLQPQQPVSLERVRRVLQGRRVFRKGVRTYVREAEALEVRMGARKREDRVQGRVVTLQRPRKLLRTTDGVFKERKVGARRYERPPLSATVAGKRYWRIASAVSPQKMTFCTADIGWSG